MKRKWYIAIIAASTFIFFASAGPFNYTFRTLETGPVESFEKNCARCHGPHGSFYGTGFGSREHKELKKIVEEMMRGPAFLQPSEADIEAMTAYHHALSSGEPFISITRYDSSRGLLHGEAILQDNLVGKQKDGKTRTISVDSTDKWQIKTSNEYILLKAENDSTVTTLDPRKNQWSHQK